MKRLQLFLLLMIAVYTASAQTTPWTGSPAITFQTRTLNGAKELRAIQSPSFVFSIMDSLRARTYAFGNVRINSGTALSIDSDGNRYYDIDYTPFRMVHGNNPAIFVLKIIIDNFPVEGVNDFINDVVVRSMYTSTLNTLRVFPHTDPSDPTKSIDDIIILIK